MTDTMDVDTPQSYNTVSLSLNNNSVSAPSSPSSTALIADLSESHGTIAIDNHVFHDTAALFEYLEMLPKPDAYQIVNSSQDIALEQLVTLSGCSGHKVYKGTDNKTEFEKCWARMSEITTKRAKDKKYMDGIVAKAVQHWGGLATKAFLIHAKTATMHQNISKMLMQKLPWKHLLNAVNNSIID
ncbi:hypothetical protein N7509_008288 [Penicillium cosmopolitanum]|uniref:Uncharacterized protein n=1 Tax=Penicillium cosmopolitanum TaxID=1131564 RepID=A0A9X0B2I7_9EURO|nr:uncharacterized protein N7509_008288 [Penicillium cosmopolitanum]KAJ5385747.1 hypothetical protein N7509_008288 [Penicillium cosmopolitanum]